MDIWLQLSGMTGSEVTQVHTKFKVKATAHLNTIVDACHPRTGRVLFWRAIHPRWIGQFPRVYCIPPDILEDPDIFEGVASFGVEANMDMDITGFVDLGPRSLGESSKFSDI